MIKYNGNSKKCKKNEINNERVKVMMEIMGKPKLKSRE
jgi:hypothetical protein